MIVEMLYNSVMWLNIFPPKGGVLNDVSPRMLLTGNKLDYNLHCQIPFGQYVQVHKENHPTNGQHSRTVGAICLGPTGNLQGRYKFMNLCTGKKILQRHWTPLSMSNKVIDHVNALGQAEGQPKLFTFYDGKGNLIGEDPALMAGVGNKIVGVEDEDQVQQPYIPVQPNGAEDAPPIEEAEAPLPIDEEDQDNLNPHQPIPPEPPNEQPNDEQPQQNRDKEEAETNKQCYPSWAR